MSMSPDDPDFLTRLQASLGQGLNSPLMGLAAGLLQAGGPSRMPVSLGQALGAGLQSGQQFQQQGIQNAMQRIQLQQALQGQQYFQGLLNNNRPPLASGQSQPTAQVGTDVASTTNGLLAPVSPEANVGSLGLMTNQPPQQTAPMSTASQPSKTVSKPQLPALLDPEQDPKYQDLLRQANLAEYFKVGSGAARMADAKARLDYLNSQTVTLSPDQANLLIPGGTVPGQSIMFHPYSGKWETGGTEALKPTSVFNAQLGTMVPAIQDVRSGKIVSGNVPDLSPEKPLPPVMESKAQAVLNGTAPPVAENRGDPAADAEMARVRYLAQQNGDTYDASTWQAKQQAVKSFGSGKLGQITAAANKSVLHLDTLEQLGDNLNNTNTPAFNHIANMWKAQTGQSAPTSFEAARQIALDEVNKFIVGSSGGVSDREKMQSLISKASSPQQLHDGIETLKEMMGGQLYALQKQYESSTGLHDFQKRYLFPQTQQLLNTIQNPNTGSTPNTAPAASTLPQGWSVQVH